MTSDMMRNDNEQQSLLASESVPGKVRLSSFLLKTSTWAVIAGSLAIVTTNIVELVTPLSAPLFYGAILGAATLIGLPLGIHEHRNAMKQANKLIKQQNEIKDELSDIKAAGLNALEEENVNKKSSDKIFQQFSANQVFFASSAAFGGLFTTIGKDIKAYAFPTTELTTPTLMVILVPGIAFTILLAYGYRKSDVIVASWENEIVSSIEQVHLEIKKILQQQRATLFAHNPPALPSNSGTDVSIDIEELSSGDQQQLENLLNINSTYGSPNKLP
jgi:hypothetical protein